MFSEPATIETLPSSKNATEGSTVVFKCRAQGTPRPTTQWLFNGQPIVDGQFISIRGDLTCLLFIIVKLYLCTRVLSDFPLFTCQ